MRRQSKVGRIPSSDRGTVRSRRPFLYDSVALWVGRTVPVFILLALVTVAWRYHPVGDYFTESDFFDYAAGGRAIARGEVDAGRFRVIGPVYLFVLAAASLVTTDLFRFATFLSAISTSLSVFLLFELLRRRFDSWTALVAAAFVAVNPVVFRYGYSASTDALATALQIGAMTLVLIGRSSGALLAAGLVAALATLTRYTGIYLRKSQRVALSAHSPSKGRR